MNKQAETDTITQTQAKQTAWMACDAGLSFIDARPYRGRTHVVLILKHNFERCNEHIEQFCKLLCRSAFHLHGGLDREQEKVT